MTLEDLQTLETGIGSKRAEREKIAAQIEGLRAKAKALSADILGLEAKLPTTKERKGITLKVEAGKVAAAARKG